MTYIEARNLPAHVGLIMDGNGRWAEQRGEPRVEGHRVGAEAVRRVVRAARRLGLRALTLYAFSEQNWGRPDEEVGSLMNLLLTFLFDERDELLEHGVRLRAIGSLARLPVAVREAIAAVERETAAGGGLVLTLALSYGGQEELTEAARSLARAVAAGALAPDEITSAHLAAALPSHDPGPLDLLVRTGGEQRLSNFVLWGAAYSELHFSPALWPDFDARDLYEAIAAYQRRERRFGLTSAQRVTRPGPDERERACEATQGAQRTSHPPSAFHRRDASGTMPSGRG